MKRLSWLLRRGTGRATGAAALLLLLACAAAVPLVLQPLHTELAQARRQLLLAEARRSPADEAPPSWEDEAERQLAAFHARLGAGATLPELLAVFHEAALAEGLVLQRADYRLSEEPQDRLARYRISLPIAGPYPGVRRFIARVLERMPAAALDQVAFERERIAEGRVEARLGFTLHLVKP
ncbi:hypothetical protein [Caldimonas tepidiphila]|uniref:hypothetical protein n=1 Tax=Caldimonas tepidiphila TaxID=2315841 RepID=UPI000E5A1471|nr:hypothetical protein [Caldimonas tepidiphila]